MIQVSRWNLAKAGSSCPCAVSLRTAQGFFFVCIIYTHNKSSCQAGKRLDAKFFMGRISRYERTTTQAERRPQDREHEDTARRRREGIHRASGTSRWTEASYMGADYSPESRETSRQVSGERGNRTQSVCGSLRQIISLMRQPRRGPLSYKITSPQSN